MVKMGRPCPEHFHSWHDDLPTPKLLDNEVSRWFNMCSRQSDRADLPDTLMKSLVYADPDIIPSIIILLVLGYTLPTKSAEAERSLSMLKLIKSSFKSRLTDTRFYTLQLMQIHYSNHIDFKRILNRFINEHTRCRFKVSVFD